MQAMACAVLMESPCRNRICLKYLKIKNKKINNCSGDCFVNVCHVLLRFVHEHRLVIPVFLFILLHIVSIWFLGMFELTSRPRSFC